MTMLLLELIGSVQVYHSQDQYAKNMIAWNCKCSRSYFMDLFPELSAKQYTTIGKLINIDEFYFSYDNEYTVLIEQFRYAIKKYFEIFIQN